MYLATSMSFFLCAGIVGLVTWGYSVQAAAVFTLAEPVSFVVFIEIGWIWLTWITLQGSVVWSCVLFYVYYEHIEKLLTGIKFKQALDTAFQSFAVVKVLATVISPIFLTLFAYRFHNEFELLPTLTGTVAIAAPRTFA